MSGDWKPGDLIVGDDWDIWFVVEVTANSVAAWGPGLHAIDSMGNGISVRDLPRTARPLAAIDPENREQIEWLIAAVVHAQDWTPYDTDDSDGVIVSKVRAALREFAAPTPPKPDEPLGFASQVRDRNGLRWVKLTGSSWLCEDGTQVGGYALVDAVEVLP